MVQLIGALFGIVLLQLLTPQDYGKIAMLMVFANLASTLQESGFTAALCNLRNPSDNDYNAVFWFNIGISALLYLVLYACAPLIARFYNDPDLLPLSRYLFLGFFISSWGTVQRAYLFIHLMNRESCIIAITSLIVSGLVGVGMAWCKMAYWGLATQQILFITVVALMNWCYSPWRPSLHIDFRPAWRMFGFSWKLLLTNIVNNLSSNAFGFLLGKFYGDYSAGVYGTARKWNDMGSNTINGMLTGVAQPVLSQVREDSDRYRQVFRKMLRFVSFVSFPCLLGIGLIAREFLLLIAGPKWEESAGLLSLICIYGAIFPLLTLYSQMTISQGRSQINMWCTLVQSTLILVGLVLMRPYGVYAMVGCFIFINVVWLFVWQYFAWRLIGLRLFSALSDVLPFLLVSIIAMVITWWITRPIENLWLLLCSKVVLAFALYLGFMWMCRARILRESWGYLIHHKV
uniref:Putative lipopolysaccharide biosynthesis protein n=1 Tax=uncultured bacterium fosmid pJB135F11 TaxID=1478051 RepID=A0A0H3U8B5_9BACT|nr:putative lipopolysaccharide biosynthesis protein [uncultured bacterium fosmid pJB135F11]